MNDVVMYKYVNRRVCFLVFVVVSVARAVLPAQTSFSYLSPVPRSVFVSRKSNIILRSDEPLDEEHAIDEAIISVTGSQSGDHSGRIVVEEDGRTLVFNPHQPFAPGETVTATLHEGLKSKAGKPVASFSFYFTITDNSDFLHASGGFDEEMLLRRVSAAEVKRKSGLPLPQNTLLDLPVITVTVSDNPSPGYLLLSNLVFSDSIRNTPYLLILDNSGIVVRARELVAGSYGFTRQPNGQFTYFDSFSQFHVALDSSFDRVDNYLCGNGYLTDLHELRVLPDGHALLLGYDDETVRMDTIVPGGKPNAQVRGCIIQELDASKNVVFQWRSWDHFKITDATHEDLTAQFIDYVHANALEFDGDSNIVLSSRHMDEITKIDRQTGQILWRWGGKNNQFTFIGDTMRFSHQHAIRRLPNGHFTMFDNGNYHIPPVSRAEEYEVDEVTKIARLVWSYRDTSISSFAMGYVQRLETGNTLIGWGTSNPTVTEVRPDGTKAFELTFPEGVYSYRAYRMNLNLTGVQSADAGSKPSSYVLDQNYPNPFNPATTITFSLPVAGNVAVDVFNALGQKVESLVRRNLSAGSHSVVWNAAGKPSGVYFYRLSAEGNSIATRKMVLIK